MANQTRKTEWLNSIITLIESVDYDYVQSCSISVVPEGLKKWNEDAYIPRKVSIGPQFMGWREDLLLIEEVKLRCMLSLIHRGAGAARESLKKCSEAVWELDEKVRASYVTSLKFEQQELAKIMLLDGCFLLELLISKSEGSKGLNSRLKSRLKPSGPAAEVLKDDDVLSDLMLLENQIPILVLHELFQTLFPNVLELDRAKKMQIMEDASTSHQEKHKRIEKLKKETRANKINDLALTVLGYSSIQLPCLHAPHILDLVHFFVNTGTGERETEGEGNNHVLIEDGVVNTESKKLKLKSCALSLQAAGVSFKVLEDRDEAISCFDLMRNYFRGVLVRLRNIIFNTEQVDVAVREVKGLDFNFKFRMGKLEIAQLHITETTKAKWRNVIVWEHHKKNGKSSSSSTQSLTSPIGKFTSSALIFHGLICCSADVIFLKEKKIIVDHTKMSNGELKEFFRTMSFGVDPGIVDSSYVQLVNELNNYSDVFFILRILKLSWHFSICCLERLIKFLKEDYNFVAALLALLSVVQTVYALLAYYLSK
ncbi:UPF0481 protein At3g47200 [Medicago truncatula]|nr:UPF0481 protein At3g47200 [Medicago truncatula]AES79484.1 DUF247 domain protein [Medicago truncatula]